MLENDQLYMKYNILLYFILFCYYDYMVNYIII